MAWKFGNKVYRNLEEQVLENQKKSMKNETDIRKLKEAGNVISPSIGENSGAMKDSVATGKYSLAVNEKTMAGINLLSMPAEEVQFEISFVEDGAYIKFTNPANAVYVAPVRLRCEGRGENNWISFQGEYDPENGFFVPELTTDYTVEPLSDYSYFDTFYYATDLTTSGYDSNFAEGWFATATGKYAHAEGGNTVAIGERSHAEGSLTYATGFGSHAEGVHTHSTALFSHAEGGETNATGNRAHSEGSLSTASGLASHAEGINTTASFNGAHSEGADTTASGWATHAEGIATRAITEAAHAEGRGSEALAIYSHAEGYNTTASRQSAHAEGNTTTAEGYYSHAEGQYTEASQIAAHAEGSNTVASGYYSHAEGTESKATNTGAHAEGVNNQANGIGSHAEGQNCIAGGDRSHAEGLGCTTSSAMSHVGGNACQSSQSGAFLHGWELRDSRWYQAVFGLYNEVPTVDGGEQLIVGCGSSAGRANAFVAGNSSALGKYIKVGNTVLTEQDLENLIALVR